MDIALDRDGPFGLRVGLYSPDASLWLLQGARTRRTSVCSLDGPENSNRNGRFTVKRCQFFVLPEGLECSLPERIMRSFKASEMWRWWNNLSIFFQRFGASKCSELQRKHLLGLWATSKTLFRSFGTSRPLSQSVHGNFSDLKSTGTLGTTSLWPGLADLVFCLQKMNFTKLLITSFMSAVY